METLADIRLSPHFTLMDFLHARTLYTSGMELSPDDFDGTVIQAGVELCNRLLEPMVEKYGPLSFSSGYIPRALLTRDGPHSWRYHDGAAADIVVHDWVNDNKAPIHLIQDLTERRVPFERMISYAGSEFICASVRDRNERGVIYENVRVAGADKPIFKQWRRMGESRPIDVPQRPDWRREHGEGIYHSRRELCAQHIRVGRYFTFLDFCRDEVAMAEGSNWVPPMNIISKAEKMARCFAEILDPIKLICGHLTITQGIRKSRFAERVQQTWANGIGQVEFVIPEDATMPVITHPNADLDYDIRTRRFVLNITEFEPKHTWSSARKGTA